MALSNEQVAKLLLDNGLVEQKKVDELLIEAQKLKKPLLSLLFEQEVVKDEQFGILVADLYKIPHISLDKTSIPHDVLELIPEEVAKKQLAIAFGQDDKGIKVAMADPSNTAFLQLLAKKAGVSIFPYYATESDIKKSMRRYHKELQKSFDALMKENLAAANKTNANDVPIAKIVDLLIEHAQHNKTSDIHIEPHDEETTVRFRIDGIMHDVLKFPVNLHEQIVSRIKIQSNLRTDEHMSAQDGKIHTQVDGQDLDIRVSLVPVVGGEKVVMRLLASQTKQLSLRDLGYSESDLKKITEGYTKPYGMVLSTGPTGSGKSTTIYSMIKMINTREVNIATIEDPVEYDIQGVNQIQVNVKTNLTFAKGLRAILRQDPDVIFVGEIRDEETAGIAINAAMTGHLVFSTLHTNDAATTLPRLIDMNIEPFLVASTVNVIIGQRLLRKICENCRHTVVKDLKEFESHLPDWVITKMFEGKKQLHIYEGKGCAVCHQTGYMGRIGIFEVLEVTESLKKLILTKADADTIAEAARAEGMTTMLEDGINKVLAGQTTMEEVLRGIKG